MWLDATDLVIKKFDHDPFTHFMMVRACTHCFQAVTLLKHDVRIYPSCLFILFYLMFCAMWGFRFLTHEHKFLQLS